MAISSGNSSSDLIPITRAARIVAPISTHPNGPFEGGIVEVIRMLGEIDIPVDANSMPPKSPYAISAPALTRDWFSALWSNQYGTDRADASSFNSDFLEWANDSLTVSHKGVLDNVGAPANDAHAQISSVDHAGKSWTVPEALAWICTREAIEVARISCSHHFDPPLGPDQSFLRAFAEPRNRDGRRKLIGWLVLKTSRDHCRCGSTRTEAQETWERCQCVGLGFEELRSCAKAQSDIYPEYLPRPADASFTLTWPEGAEKIKFPRSEIRSKWPSQNRTVSKVGTEEQCKEWLRKAFSSDSAHTKSKQHFMDEALREFSGRITKTAFMQRVWPSVAPNFGRDKPGPKSNS